MARKYGPSTPVTTARGPSEKMRWTKKMRPTPLGKKWAKLPKPEARVKPWGRPGSRLSPAQRRAFQERVMKPASGMRATPKFRGAKAKQMFRRMFGGGS